MDEIPLEGGSKFDFLQKQKKRIAWKLACIY